MPNPVLIVHGWSDTRESFEPIKAWLVRQGRPTEQIFLGGYASMDDEVTFDDLALGLQQRFEELGKTGQLPLDPFSMDVIVHSTGGPVIRHWLAHYLRDITGGDLARCPIRNLIMLAPANFGSRLAAQGKTTLAKLFKGGLSHGFETGKRILEGLEPGSPALWRMADDDLFGPNAAYPGHPRGPFVYVLSGTATYGELKGFVARGASEDGSDGTVRAAAASLNSIRIVADYSQDRARPIRIDRPVHAPIAFRLVPGKNHSTIVPSATDGDTHPTYDLLAEMLRVSDAGAYTIVRDRFQQATDEVYASEAGKAEADRVHAYQQFCVRVRDELGNDVHDYRIEFHVVDDSISKSTFTSGRRPDLGPLQEYQDFTQRLQEDIIADVQPHSVNLAYRTFYVNLDRLERLRADLAGHPKRPYIAINIDAYGATPSLMYNTDNIQYRRVDVPIPDGRGGTIDFFKRNTSTLVDFVLDSAPSAEMFTVAP